jgi:N-acetylmuramoyl-L-alanine amidase
VRAVVSGAAALAAAAAVAMLPSAAAAPAPVVVVDPGHDLRANPATEPIGPGSAVRKVKDGGGTAGEAPVVLAISQRLRALLERAGVRVVMTRTGTAGTSMGNVARARIANRAGAALFLRVHADGSSDPAARGTHTLTPAWRRGWTDDIAAPSLRAARLVQAELVRALGLPDRGIDRRADITGFNWADVPVILTEVGFLTNAADRRVLASVSGQQRAAVGLCRGVLLVLGRPVAACDRASVR